MIHRRFNSDNIKALAIAILFMMAFCACKRDGISEEQLNRKFDSVMIFVNLQGKRIEAIENRKAKKDTIIIENHKSKNHVFNQIDHFNDSTLNRFNDSVKRTNHIK